MTNDLNFHLTALKEVNERRPVPALWAKAHAAAGGDPNRTRARYMMLRVLDLSVQRKEAARAEAGVATKTPAAPMTRAAAWPRPRARQISFATALGLVLLLGAMQLLSNGSWNGFAAKARSGGASLDPQAPDLGLWSPRATSKGATIADPGDAPAQTGIGDRFYSGRGAQRDYAAAAAWYLKAAEQGYAKAQVDLAVMYKFGEGVPRDYKQSALWLHKAADQGDAAAQVNLGLLYQFGQGVAQDDAAAAAWFRRAADQGDARGLDYLAALYETGQGVPQSAAEAYKLWTLAVARTPAWETELNAEALRNRDRAASRLAPAQIIEAQKLAREWKPG